MTQPQAAVTGAAGASPANPKEEDKSLKIKPFKRDVRSNGKIYIKDSRKGIGIWASYCEQYPSGKMGWMWSVGHVSLPWEDVSGFDSTFEEAEKKMTEAYLKILKARKDQLKEMRELEYRELRGY